MESERKPEGYNYESQHGKSVLAYQHGNPRLCISGVSTPGPIPGPRPWLI